MLYTLIAFILFVLAFGFYLSAPRYRGPVSDHFNGKQFRNPSGKNAQTLGMALKWAITRKPGRWTEITDATYGAPPPEETHSVRITFINHTTFLLQVDGVNILTDPVYSQRTSPFQFAGPKRMRPPGIRFEDLPRIDLVLLSHNHYDHLDAPTIKQLKREHDPTFVTPLGVAAYLRQLGIEAQDLDWWQSHSVNEDLEILSVPAQHFSGRGMFDRDATLWCGYVLKRPNGHIYFAGDTGYHQPLFTEIGERAGPFALSIIPIGAYKPRWMMSAIHVSPAEAVQIHQDVRSQQSVASHFGTFPLADDGMGEAEQDLQKALAEQYVPEKQFWILAEGEGRLVE